MRLEGAAAVKALLLDLAALEAAVAKERQQHEARVVRPRFKSTLMDYSNG
jgi:hypothetical protein